MSGYILGPFIVEPSNDEPFDCNFAIIDSRKTVATVYGNGEQEMAIATLFAAAPAMLRFIRCVLEYEERVHPEGSPFASEARELIRKAGGEP